MFNNIPPAGFPQIDLSQDVKRINAEISGMTSDCTNILTDITAETVTVSGNPISLSDALATDAISVVAEIEPSQDLHGYDRPWSGGSGKNKLPLVLADIKSANTYGTWAGNVYSYNGVDFTVNTDSDGNITSITANGTASGGNANLFLIGSSITFDNDIILNGISSGSNSTYYIRASIGSSYPTASTGDVSITAGTISAIWIGVVSGATVSNVTFYPMIRLATETDATFEPYTNICPISGMTEVNVSTTDGTDTNTATTSLGTTIYGGSVDMTEGSGSVSYKQITLSSEEQLTGFTVSSAYGAFATVADTTDVKVSSAEALVLCSKAKSVAYNDRVTDYTSFRIWSDTNNNAIYIRASKDANVQTVSELYSYFADADIVYPLATPTTLSLTPTTLAMLEGGNEISTDAEEVSVEYVKNTLVGRVRRLEEEQ